MTKIIINAGACGFTITVRAVKGEAGKISVTLETECEAVKKMAEDLAVLDRFTPLARIQSNPVYVSASKHVKHAACPVPSGILKAIEVEAGLNVSKDASIIFVKE